MRERALPHGRGSLARWAVSLLLAAAAAIAAPAAWSQAAGSITVSRPDGTRVELDAAALARLPRERLSARAHDKTQRYGGIDLRVVLGAAGLEPPQRIRGPQLRRLLVASAPDGYQVVFSWAELDPSIGAKKVLLVDRENDAPLPAEAGPWRLVVPSEERPARWVRQVVRLAVVDAP